METLLQKRTVLPAFSSYENLPRAVCLVIVPSGFLLDERVFPSLGILKVAAMLEKAGITVRLLDLSGIKNYLAVIADFITLHPDIVWFGLTSTTPQLPAATLVAAEIRTYQKDCKIILGGPHITMMHAAHRNEQKNGIIHGRAGRAMEKVANAFDVLISGDGEIAIFEAFSPSQPKFIDADVPHTPLFLTNEILTELPWPARHLIDMKSYHFSIDGIPAASMIAQLGCPFGCKFCGGRNVASFRRVRTRTSESIVAEMEFLYTTYGIRGFMMYDDELNVNPDMIELMQLIADKQSELDTTWRLRGFIKSQLFTDTQAKAMYAAGFRWILVGFESGSEKILSIMDKRATRAQNSECMRIARRNGLKVKALMSIGHPGESPATIAETRDWLLEVRPDEFDISIITCFGGTDYYDKAVAVPGTDEQIWVYRDPKTGEELFQLQIDFSVESEFYKGKPGECKAFVFTKTLSTENIVKARFELEVELRDTLGIPFPKAEEGLRFEHSMGQFGGTPYIPENMLRSSQLY